MYTKAIEGKIVFYYPHGSLFEDVQHMSAYMCKNVVSKDGEDLSERYAITDDEADMFSICLRETVPEVYDAVKVLTHGIEDALYDDILGSEFETLDPAFGELDLVPTERYVVIITQDNAAYNPNEPKLADSAIQTALEQGALAEFYVRVAEKSLTEMSAAQFDLARSNVSRRIIGLRKKTSL